MQAFLVGFIRKYLVKFVIKMLNDLYNYIQKIISSKKIDKKKIGVALKEYRNTSGIPDEYDLEGNSIFIYPPSSYASTAGGRLIYRRRPDYFTASDTIQEPGFPAPFHRILSYGAAYDYAVAKGLPNVNHLFQQIERLHEGLNSFFSRRGEEKQPRIIPQINDYR